MSAHDDDERIALHEAGHAVIAVELGHELGPVTIVGTEYYGGLTVHNRATEIPDADLAFAGPLPLMPARLRQEFEASVCVSLAGAVAEELLWAEDPLSRPRRRPTSARHERPSPVDRVPGLSSADEAAIKQAQRPLADDDENAWAAAVAFVGASSPLEVTAAFVRYCEAVTRDLVAQHRGAVRRLADALLAHGTLSGEAARAIIGGPPLTTPARPDATAEDPIRAAAGAPNSRPEPRR